MSAKTVKFLLSDGSTIYVETVADGEAASDEAASSGVEIVPRFERAVSRLQPLASTLLQPLKAAEPGKTAIAFALKFDAAGEPVVAAGDEGAAFRITLEWQVGARSPDRQGERPRGRPFEDRRGGYDDRRGPPRGGPPRGGGPKRPGFRKDRDRD